MEQRDFIATPLRAGVRLSKIRRLLARQGVVLAPATSHRRAGDGARGRHHPRRGRRAGEELVYVDTG